MKVHTESSKKKRAKKRSKKRNSNNPKKPRTKSTLFQETKFESSSDESNSRLEYKITEVSNSKIKLYPSSENNACNEFNFHMVLTPSKSECENTDYVVTENETNTVSYSMIEDESSDSLSSENESYFNISDAFINSVEDTGIIKSSPIKTLVKCDVRKSTNSVDLSNTKQKEKRLKTKKHTEKIESTKSQNKVEINNCTTLSSSDYCYTNTNDGILLVLPSDSTIYFHGLMLVQVLHGEIEILGHKITKNCKNIKTYSLRGTSLLYIKNITTSEIPLANYLTSFSNELKLTPKCAVVLCKELNDPQINFIEKHMSQQILPKDENVHMPRVVLQPNGGWNLIQPHKEWDGIVDGVHKATRMIICGGKGVGKTTFLRYAINRLLMKFSEVYVIDLDPGQAEFTVPGCISIVKVKEPLFGVNFTHLKNTERSILSNINIAYEPQHYLASVKELLQFDFDELPTLVNYMGYTHGIGLNLVSAVITYLQPTDLLEIDSKSNKRNYRHALDLNVVQQNAELFVNSSLTNLQCKLHKIQSMCDENDGWTAEPRQLREMCVLAYISRMIQSNSIFKVRSPLYRINISDVKICDLNGKHIHPAAINANLVALCTLANEGIKIFNCLGWGIVRGIDVISNTLVILTSEELTVLENVTHVVLGSATLPPSVYMTPDEVVGQIPYVIEGLLMSLGQIPKRSRISVKNKKVD